MNARFSLYSIQNQAIKENENYLRGLIVSKFLLTMNCTIEIAAYIYEHMYTKYQNELLSCQMHRS